jgi:hypothetical protein
LDIFDQRGPRAGWRSGIGKEKKCVVIENTQPWTNEADMIVLPNLLDKHPPDPRRKIRKMVWMPLKSVGPKVIGGEQFIILRNEIRRLASNLPPKAIDVLVYLHDREKREWIRDLLESLTATSKILACFEKNLLLTWQEPGSLSAASESASTKPWHCRLCPFAGRIPMCIGTMRPDFIAIWGWSR